MRFNISHVWQGFMEVVPLIRQSLRWQSGSSNLIRVGIDCFVGGKQNGILSEDLLQVFHPCGYYTLDHLCTHSIDRRFYWLGPIYFRLEGTLKDEWSGFILSLNRSGISLRKEKDRLFWSTNSVDGTVTSKYAYDYLFTHYVGYAGKWWACVIWKWKVSVKLNRFFWLVIYNRILTWDNLCRRG